MNTPESTPESTPTHDETPTPSGPPARGGASTPAGAPTPGPTPVPRRPGSPAPAAQSPTPAPAPAGRPGPPAQQWGRVAEDGTVFVRTADGERPVGQMPDATPEEALAFFVRRYDDLALRGGAARAAGQGRRPRPGRGRRLGQAGAQHGADAQAVGDLAGLDARLDALTGTIDSAAREAAQGERPAKLEEARRREGAHRRGGRAARPRATTGATAPTGCAQLLDEWKALPRLEKSVDDALWRRFSTARTTYTRRRKAHFAELNEKREGARERQGEARRGGRGAGRLDRVGPDRRASTAT